MNTRIDKIAEQAGLWNDMEPTRREGRYVGHMNVSDVEKFAELIIRECAEVADNADATRQKWEGIGKYVREHFGVEE